HHREDRMERTVEMRIDQAAVGPRPDTVSLSERAIQAGVPPEAQLASEAAAIEDDALPPGLSLARMLIEYLLGRQVAVFDPGELRHPGDVPVEAPPNASSPRPPNAGTAVEVTETRTRVETESTTVGAQGIVRTADGREIRFDLQIELQRAYRESST